MIVDKKRTYLTKSLSGKYKIALTEIIIIHKWFNVSDVLGNDDVHVRLLNVNYAHKVPDGFYSIQEYIDNVMAGLNVHIKEIKDMYDLKYNPLIGKIEITNRRPKNLKVDIPFIDGNGYPKVIPFTYVMVKCSNLIDLNERSILAMVPVKALRIGDVSYFSAQNLIYKSIDCDNIVQLDVDIVDPSGKSVNCDFVCNIDFMPYK